MEYQTLPNQRSLINANRGIFDGEAARIWEINESYPNLIRVPVSIHSLDLLILSRHKIVIKKMSDLKNYHIGVIRGMKISEKLAKDIEPLSITAATSHLSLFKMLKNNRLDIIISNKIGLFTNISAIKNKGFHLVKKPLISRPLYVHLHQKHKALVPKFEKVFKSMRDDGTYQRIRESFLDSIEGKIRNITGGKEDEK